MHGKLIRRLLPSWLGPQSAYSAGASSELSPQRTLKSAGCKEDFQQLFGKSFTVQASSTSDGALAMPVTSRNRLYRPQRSPTDAADNVECRTVEDQLRVELGQIASWDFNVLEVYRLSGQRPLFAVMMRILDVECLLDDWKLGRAAVEALVAAVEGRYRQRNPYHNATHAADVVQTTWLFLRAAAERVPFTRLEVFSALLAAAVHDLAHPGVTNDFLVRSKDPLALRHGGGGGGVNELHHVATFFGLLQQDGHHVLSGLSSAEQQEASELVRSAVLQTDMGAHSDLVAQFAAARAAAPDLATWVAAPQRALLLRFLLHAADLSNPCRPPPLGTVWGERVCAEFLDQGDKEAALGMHVTPACDRRSVLLSASQLRFVDVFLEPMLPHVCWALSPRLCARLRAGLDATVAHWKEHAAKVAQHRAHPHRASLGTQVADPWPAAALAAPA